MDERIRLHFQKVDELETWEEGLYKATAELLQMGVLTSMYLKEIIEQIHRSGPYMAITKEPLFLHARPHEGVRKPFIAFLRSKRPIDYFGKDIKNCFVFGATNDKTHQNLLSLVSRYVSAMVENPSLIDGEAFLKWFRTEEAKL